MADRRPPRRQGKPASRPGPGAQRRRKPLNAGSSVPPGSHELERLQKVLAHAGIDSRRACEELILQGRVTVDGQIVRELGTRVDPNKATIAVDGQPIRLERPVYFAVSKPRGYVSTNDDPAGRPRVVDLLPEIPQRVYTVGRLDEMSVGLMILTNDGELANRLAHPKYGVEKIYRVIVAGNPTREVLDQLTEGLWLAEGKVRAKRVRVIGHKGESTVLEMVLAEGKNREVRRMLARLGHKVMALTRVAVGPIMLKGLRPGEYRPLSAHEVDLLRRVAAGLPIPETGPRHRDARRPAGPARPPGPARPGTARPTGPAARRPAGSTPGRPAAGPGARAGGARPTGPASQRPQRRPEGPPPQRLARPAPPTPTDEPAGRRIIGLDAESGGPRDRRPPSKRRTGAGGPAGRPARPRPPLRKRRPGPGGAPSDE